MPDLRELLDREADRVQGSVETLEHVVRCADRRRRARRVGVGALALTIAALGSIGALRAFRTGPGELRPVGAAVPWPQATHEEAVAAQAASDAGDGSHAWQLDPTTVIRRFAAQELGWGDVWFLLEDTARSQPEASMNRTIDMDLSDVSGPVGFLISECAEGSCQAADVTIERLVRRDPKGLWFVTVSETHSTSFDEAESEREVRAEWVPDESPSDPNNNYVFTDIEVSEGPAPEGAPVDEDQVIVYYRVRWSADSHPGVRRCSWTLVDETGGVVGESSFPFSSDAPDTAGRDWTDFRVSGPASSASVECSERRLDDPNGRYELSDAKWTGPSTVSFSAEWKGTGKEVGTAQCVLRAYDGREVELDQRRFTLGIHDGRQTLEERFRLRPGEEAASAVLSCGPWHGEFTL